MKIRLQTRGHLYNSGRDAFRSIWRSEGPRGFMKGVLPPTIGVAAINGIIFGVEGACMKVLKDETTTNHIIAGGITGGVQCIITGPMELVKTRMQVTGIGESKTKSSLVRTAGQIYKTNGLLGFTAGFGATITREIPAFMCYFGSYDMFLKIQNYHPSDENGILKVLMAGGFAGVCSWILTYPVDIVKSKQQADISGEFSSAFDCIRKTQSREGIRGFYRGISTTLVRAFPVNAVTFGAVEASMQLLSSL